MFFNTLFEIFIFCPKIQLWFPEKMVNFFGVKNSQKCCSFGLFSCWQLWFHEKDCQKNLVEKLVKMLGFCLKIEFLDKNLTFPIVCSIFFFLFAIFLCVYAISVFLYHFFVLRNFFAFYAFRVLRFYARFTLSTLTYYAFFHFFSIWIFAPKVYL